MEDDPEWHTNRGIDVPTTISAEEEITREAQVLITGSDSQKLKTLLFHVAIYMF